MFRSYTFSGHTLDLIITRKTDDQFHLCLELVVYFQIICLSSVNLTWVRYTLPNQTFRIGTSQRLIWMPSEADLSNSDLCKNTDLSDIHELAKSYNETLESVINRHAPLRRKQSLLDPMYLGLIMKLNP